MTGVVDGSSSSAITMPKSLYEAPSGVVSSSTQTDAIMHPTKDQRTQWNHDYLAAPDAVARPGGTVSLEQEKTTTSLLNYITYNATERDQKECGNCWAWSGTGAIEIAHASQNGVYDRLSIQYLNSRYKNGGRSPFTSADYACNSGGTVSYFSDFYNLAGIYGGNKTSIPWSNTNAAFQDGNTTGAGHTNVEPNTIGNSPSYSMGTMVTSRVNTIGLTQEKAIENIKSMINSGKPVLLSFSLPNQEAWNAFRLFWNNGIEEDSYFDLDAYKGETYSSSGGSHMILVVGYATNGTEGYWQCLNSWGSPTYRPNGVLYINQYLDYSATYPDAGDELPVSQWETLDVTYKPTNTTPNGTPNLSADFDVSPSTGYNPLTVHFTDLSEGEPNSWKWNFGDGGGSIMSNPNHTYSKPGKYSVSLLIGKSGYSSLTEQKDAVTVKYPYVTVTPFPKPEGGNYSVPTDPDGDGRYEDINGNGWLENEDPVILLKNLDWVKKNEPVIQFDFDGSGFIGYSDVVSLKKMV